jgi:putative DNA primase/helicase
MVPFSVTIPENERDPDLQTKLLAELPGILAWAVRGCLAWQRKGLAPPEEIMAATREYRDSEDTFRQWLEDRCVLGDDETATAADLLTSFIDFSKWKGTTSIKLGKMLADAGFISEKSGARRWRGLKLLPTGTTSHWQDRDH